MNRQEILKEIDAEREYQINKWGDEVDVKINRPSDFISYIVKYSTSWYDGTFFPFKTSTVDAFRRSMIKVAAIAVAAVEALDKQRAEDGSAFYEDTVI